MGICITEAELKQYAVKFWEFEMRPNGMGMIIAMNERIRLVYGDDGVQRFEEYAHKHPVISPVDLTETSEELATLLDGSTPRSGKSWWQKLFGQ